MMFSGPAPPSKDWGTLLGLVHDALAAGVDPNATDKDGATALSLVEIRGVLRQLSCGGSHSAALTDDGQLLSGDAGATEGLEVDEARVPLVERIEEDAPKGRQGIVRPPPGAQPVHPS